MLARAELLRLHNIPCFAHSLNVVVGKALETTLELADIRTRAKKVVSFFKTSTRAKEKLREVQAQLKKPHQLSSMSISSNRCGATKPCEAVAECLEVLGPLSIATTALSEEKKVSASKVIPRI